jgi:hypothetical protein
MISIDVILGIAAIGVAVAAGFATPLWRVYNDRYHPFDVQWERLDVRSGWAAKSTVRNRTHHRIRVSLTAGVDWTPYDKSNLEPTGIAEVPQGERSEILWMFGAGETNARPPRTVLACVGVGRTEPRPY